MTEIDVSIDGFDCRPMQADDLKTILQIERNTQVSPWSRLSFEEALTRSTMSEGAKHKFAQRHFCRVAQVGDSIVGFHVCSSVADELHILNLAIAKKFQGLGFGHGLMQDIISISDELALEKVFLEVRASNTVAQSLYQKWQFRKLSLRKNYYSGYLSGSAAKKSATSDKVSGNITDREDAYVFVRTQIT